MATLLDVGVLGFFLPVFVFMFLFTVLFAVLEKTKILGENRLLNIGAAFYVGCCRFDSELFEQEDYLGIFLSSWVILPSSLMLLTRGSVIFSKTFSKAFISVWTLLMSWSYSCIFPTTAFCKFSKRWLILIISCLMERMLVSARSFQTARSPTLAKNSSQRSLTMASAISWILSAS